MRFYDIYVVFWRHKCVFILNLGLFYGDLNVLLMIVLT